MRKEDNTRLLKKKLEEHLHGLGDEIFLSIMKIDSYNPIPDTFVDEELFPGELSSLPWKHKLQLVLLECLYRFQGMEVRPWSNSIIQ